MPPCPLHARDRILIGVNMIPMTDSWSEVWYNFQHVGLAYLLTASIGWEREREAHSAGVRTFPIVGMASCGYLLLLGLQNPTQRSHSVNLFGSRLINRGVVLRSQKYCSVCGQRLLQGAHRTRAADFESNLSEGENDYIADGHHWVPGDVCRRMI